MNLSSTAESPFIAEAKHDFYNLTKPCQWVEVFIGTLGFIINFYVLLLISYWRAKSSSVYNSLLICLSVVQCLFAITIVALNSILITLDLPSEQTPITDIPLIYLWNIEKVLWTIFPVWILWIICVMIIDRYMMIIKPFNYGKRIPFHHFIAFLLFILFLLLFFIQPLLINKDQVENCKQRMLLCAELLSQLPLHLTVVHTDPFKGNIWFVVFFLLPATIIIMCNVHLFLIIADHRKRIQRTICSVNLRKGFEVQWNNHRDLFTTTLNLFFTIILVIPYFANLFIQLIFNEYNPTICNISLLLVTFTPLVNGYVYGLRCRAMKRSLKLVLQVRIRFFLLWQTSMGSNKQKSIKIDYSFENKE